LKKVSTLELSSTDVEKAILMYLQKSGEDLGTEAPAIILTSDKKGKGCEVEASVTLSTEVQVDMGHVKLTVLPKKPGVVEAFKKPAKTAAELVEALDKQEEVTTAAASKVIDVIQAAKEVGLLEEEAPLVEEEVLVEDEPEEGVVEVKPKTASSDLFAKKEIEVVEVLEEGVTVETTPTPANTKKDNLFG
jgi:hypothetical protein